MIDSRDVNVCEAYMRYFVNEQCIDEPEMFPFLDPKPGQNAIHFKAPSPSSYSSYVCFLFSLSLSPYIDSKPLKLTLV
jgi:hypothetical protein